IREKNKLKDILNKKSNNKTICITGPPSVGKSIISINLAKINIYSKNKILIVDLDFINNSVNTILGIKNIPINKKEINSFINIIKINKKIDLLYLIKTKENNNLKIKDLINIINDLKNVYE